MAVVLPQVNLNGSSVDYLIEVYTKSIIDLKTAIASIEAINPHGRDYQILNNYSEARKEYDNYLSELDRIVNELGHIRRDLLKQKVVRSRVPVDDLELDG